MGHPHVRRSSGRIAPARCFVVVAELVAAMACATAPAQGQGTGGTEERAGERKPTGAESRRDQRGSEGAPRESESSSEGRGLRSFVAAAKLGYEGECILRQGHYARALPLLEAAHAEGLKVPFPESLETLKVNRAPTDGGGMRAITENRLGIAHAAVANYARAERYLRAALNTDVTYFRDDNNRCIAEDHFDLAFVQAARGRYDDAEDEYAESIRILKANKRIKVGKLYLTAHRHLGLASLSLARGRAGDAEGDLEIPLLVLKEKGVDAKHPVLAAHARIVLGQLRDREGRPDEAAQEYRHALTVCRTLGPDHPMAAFCLDGLGELDLEAGKLDEAEAHFKEALALREKMLGKEHRELAYGLDGLGRVAAARGDWAAAEPRHARAFAILEKCLGIDHPDVAVVALHRSRALRRLGRDAEATALDRRIPSHPGLSSQGRFLAIPDDLFCEYCLQL